MIRLSVNVNKVATLRNARGHDEPSLIEAVRTCLDAGAPGITVHPREDQRHIRPQDVYDIAELLSPLRQQVEYNIEGDPRPDLLDIVRRVKPHQFTLVPVRSGELTSEAGWSRDLDPAQLRRVVADLKHEGIRVAVFVDPEPAAVEFAASLGADRVELFTAPFADAFSRSSAEGLKSYADYERAAEAAARHGLGINAGHDLNLDNMRMFGRLPGLQEVSIGHSLISRALFRGLAPVVREYAELVQRI